MLVVLILCRHRFVCWLFPRYWIGPSFTNAKRPRLKLAAWSTTKTQKVLEFQIQFPELNFCVGWWKQTWSVFVSHLCSCHWGTIVSSLCAHYLLAPLLITVNWRAHFTVISHVTRHFFFFFFKDVILFVDVCKGECWEPGRDLRDTAIASCKWITALFSFPCVVYWANLSLGCLFLSHFLPFWLLIGDKLNYKSLPLVPPVPVPSSLLKAFLLSCPVCLCLCVWWCHINYCKITE